MKPLRQSSILHLLVFGFATFALSCLHPPEFDKEDGTPFSEEALQDNLAESWGEFNPHEMLKGEINYQEKSVKISTSEARPVLLKTTSVYDVAPFVEDPSYLVYTLAMKSKEDPEHDLPTPSVRERNIIVPTQSEESSTAVYANKNPEAMGLAARLHRLAFKSVKKYSNDPNYPILSEAPKLLDEESDSQLISVDLLLSVWHMCTPPTKELVAAGLVSIECFNLKTTPLTKVIPKTNLGDGCQGFPDCRIKAKKIEFDIVYVTKESETSLTTRTKLFYSVTVSAEAPFLSKVLELCYKGMAAVQNQKFPVTICHNTTNFLVGSKESE